MNLTSLLWRLVSTTLTLALYALEALLVETLTAGIAYSLFLVLVSQRLEYLR